MAVIISNIIILVILSVACAISVGGLVIGSVAYQRTTEESSSQEREFTFPLKSTVTGNAAEPAYTFEASMNTGIFLQNVTSLGITSNGVELARFGQGLRVEDGVTGEANSSLILDVQSTEKGSRFCPMSTTERDAITSPVSGSLIYNTNSNAYQYYNGSSWLGLGGGGTAVFPLTANLSTALNPEYTFIGQTNTGMYSDGLNVNFSANGVQSLGVEENQVLVPNGVSVNAPGLAFIGETDLGLRRFAEGVISFSADSVDSVHVDVNGIALIDGSTTNPSMRFLSNPDTGLYYDPSGTFPRIRVSIDGLTRYTIQTSRFDTPAIYSTTLSGTNPPATSGNLNDVPNIAYGAGINCGLYFPILDKLGLATSGTNAMYIDSNQAISIGDFSNGQALTNLPASVLLTLNATNRALQLTRMTKAERDAIASPETALLTFTTQDRFLNYFNGQVWVEVGSGTTDTFRSTYLGVDIFPIRNNINLINNICIGETLGTNVTDAENNIFIGYRCATSPTTINDSIIIGNDSGIEATDGNVIIGHNAATTNNYSKSVVLGFNACSQNQNDLIESVVIGNSSYFSGTSGEVCLVVGYNSEGNDRSIVLGSNSESRFEDNILIGHSISAVQNGAQNLVIIGNGINILNGESNSVCIGQNWGDQTNFTGNSVAIGSSISGQVGVTASVTIVGSNIVCEGRDNVGIGEGVNIDNENCVVIGQGSSSLAQNCIVIGHEAKAPSINALSSITIGNLASTTEDLTVNIGSGAVCNGPNSVVIGAAALSGTGSNNVMIGRGTGTSGTGSNNIVIGTNTGSLVGANSNVFQLGNSNAILISGDLANLRFGIGSSAGFVPVPSVTNGDRGFFLANSTVSPAGTVSDGGIVYGTGQELKYLDTAGNDRFLLSQTYTSPNQAITTSGTFTVAHGLSARPNQVSYFLECLAIDAGYGVGDIVQVSVNNNNFTCVVTSTQITVRFDDGANVFELVNLGDGSNAVLNNASWEFFIVASYMD